ncbi:hypothetical protein [Brachybacterium phenoliresistens]|uniref:Galactosyl transferase GMA12/MNN10 family protein n=1 Tax=Brachybacterium phenoliresistens TaxID=396014 RepID=Z9JTM1_9MICO|nr:hypothetical protein [Brachybacterium phenoliresistens]EWS81730.1 hypothetical protein BF93_15245 [Brachybacterium phenoliresistens]
MSDSDICIVSGADEIRLRSYVNHRIFAHEHQLDYRLECGLDRDITNPFFFKSAILRRVLPKYAWIAWIDDDAFFTDFERDTIGDQVRQAEESGEFLVIAEGPLEPNGFWSKINSGVVLLRNDARGTELLRRLTSVPLETVRSWWDEDRDGVFTGGDQDQMWWALNESGLLHEARIVSHRDLNSRGHYYESSLTDNAVMHFCGHRDKALGIARFAQRFGIGHELVPDHLLDRYSVRRRSPMGRAELAARAARQEAIGRAKPYLKPIVTAVREQRARRKEGM